MTFVQFAQLRPWWKGDIGNLSYMCFNFSYVVSAFDIRYVWKPHSPKTNMLKTKAKKAAIKLHQYYRIVSPKISYPSMSEFSSASSISLKSMTKFAMHMMTSKMIVSVKCEIKM